MNKLINAISGLLKKGLFHVFGANIINKIVAFVCNILVVRLVAQIDYGYYTSAYNVITIAMLITGAGTLSGALQYGSEQRGEEEKKEYFKYCLAIGIVFDLILSVGILGYAFGELMPIKETKQYIIFLTPTILLHYIFEYFGVLLRSQKRVKEYARLLNVNSILLSTLSCLGALLGGVSGLILGRVIAYLVSWLMGMFYNKELLEGIFKSETISNVKKKDVLKYSISCCLIAALNRLLYTIDVTVITYIVKDPETIAIYKVGTLIPEALDFIPHSILVVISPYFAEHNKDNEWLRNWTKKLYTYTGLFNLMITLFLVVTASWVVTFLWGAEYMQSVPIYIVLSLSFFVSATFRQTGTNVLSTLRKTTYNLVISCITGVANIILDIWLVTKFGIYGAAIATLVAVIFASALSLPYVYKLIYSGEMKNEKENIG